MTAPSTSQAPTRGAIPTDLAGLYAKAEPAERRMLNRDLFDRITHEDDDTATIRPKQAIATILASDPSPHNERTMPRDHAGQGSNAQPGRKEATERCGNRRPRVERLASAWNQGARGDADLEGEPDDPQIGASAEPKKRPRTRLTESEVDALRTAREQGVGVVALARQFRVHRGTV